MANTIQVHRGAFADLPTLNAGEIGFCTDTYQVFIGDGATNHELSTLVSAALTKTDDTNVTLALGGGHAAALLSATSLTLGWTGQLAPTRGGTGINNAGTFTNATNSSITGGGTLALGGFTLTIPATGTAALLGVANVFTETNTFPGVKHAPQATPSGDTGHVAYDSTKERLVLQHEHHDFPVPVDLRNTFINQVQPMLYGTMEQALTWSAVQTFSAAPVFSAGFTGTLSEAHTWLAVQTFSAGFMAAATCSIAAAEAGSLLTLDQQSTGDILELQDDGTSVVRFPDQGGLALVPQSGGFQAITGLLGYDDDKDRLVLKHEHHDFPVPIDPRNTFINQVRPMLYGTMEQALTWAAVQTFNAGVVLPKTSGYGIKVDTAAPTFGWQDLLGNITNAGGANKPTRTTYRGGIDQYLFSAGDEAILEFHIPHDYVPGTDIYLHVHWSHISTLVTGGTVTFTAESTYAKGHNQAPFSAPATGTFVGTASTTQYQHILSETQYSASAPAGLQLDTDDLEVDGVILVRLEMTTNNITSSGAVPDPFIHYVDVHYQSTGIGTKANAPDFYT